MSASVSGAQWLEVRLPQPFSSGYYLDVFFLPSNPNLGWACSMEGHIVRTNDGGKTWQGFTIPGAFLEYVQFVNERTGFVSGQGGVFRSDDGGASWIDITPFPMVQDKGWGSYWLNDRIGIYFVGGCINGTQAFYRTSDGGRSWTVFYGNEPNSGLSDGYLYNDGSGWAVSSGVLWKTMDFGRTWYKFSNTGPRYWTEEISVFGRSILLPTSGQDCDGQTRNAGSLRFSRDGGVSWKEFQTRKNMFGCFLLSERVGWGVGDDRTVLYTDDSGDSWTLRNCGIRGNIDDIYFVNDTLGWAVGEGIYKSNFSSSSSSIVISPPDSVVYLCPNDSLLVEARGPFGNYRWNDNLIATSRVLRDTGTYIVRAYDSLTCVFVADTIRIAAKSTFAPSILASKNAICEGDTVTLSVAGPIRQLQWSTGDTARSIVVSGGGPYTCTIVDSAGCTRTTSAVTIKVNPNPSPVITASRNLVMCLDDTVSLGTSRAYSQYRWSNGATSSVIRVATSGLYTVDVLDSNGCAGSADTVEVTVLNTRNKAEFVFDAGTTNEYVIEDHDVGSLACRDVTIRNRSTFENLIISKAHFIGNVYFSVPRAQFPVIIPPLAASTIRVCASAQDVGLVKDTLALQDTCSMVTIPFVTTGNSIKLTGTSRCDVEVHTTIFRAGGAWRLRAPFPVPAQKTLSIVVTPPAGQEADLRLTLRNIHGQVVLNTTERVAFSETPLRMNIVGLETSLYFLAVEDGNGLLASYPVIVVQ
jgi:photosystem II stability/assembly factor-like uncharacterized protein